MVDVINDITERLIETPEIERVVLFGSRARADHDPRSDIDLAIECPSASRDLWQRIRDMVEATRTLLFIDVVRLDTAPAALKAKVREEGVVLYER
ncbi:MAG: nucleotidyltransferase domain-containing protein [Bacteroidota bacterium]